MDLSLVGVMKFLHRFGYLSLPHDLASDYYPDRAPQGRLGKWDDAVQDALMRYQLFHKLPQNIVQDDDCTLAHMCTRRCGHPDNIYGVSAATMRWRKNNLLWKLENLSPDLPQNWISAAFNIGFGAWADKTPLKFTEALPNQQADINITFKVLDTPGQVLAKAYFPEVGTMEFDESELWSWTLPIGRGQVDLATVVMHEAGHVIGLEHSSVRGAQMAPVYAGAMRYLANDDIVRAQSMYGSKP